MIKNLFLFTLCALASLATKAQTATVNLNSERQVIRGFGGMNHPIWIGDLTEEQRNVAFGNGPNQLGFTIVRIFVSENKDNWYREVETAKKAIEMGGIVFASPWNPPSEMTETFTKTGDDDAKRLRYDKYADYAQWLNDFVTYMKDNGVDLYAISVQNEPDYAHDWTWWTPAEMLRFMKENAGSINCRVIAPESFSYLKNMSDPILNDPEALANMDILGAHLYGTSYGDFSYPLFKQKGAGKELWMTEVYHPNSNTNSQDLWPEALEVGYHIHNAMAEAEFQAYVWWYIRRHYGPMREDGTISKRGFCMTHYSKFIRPGFVRIDATKNPTTDVYVSAYKKGNDVVIVAINKSTSGKTITLSYPAGNIPSWEKYVTSATKDLAKEENVTSSTSFEITLDPQSITTLTGQVDYWAPVLKSAEPENNSFDLPLTHDTYQFNYDVPIDCSKAKATIEGPIGTVDLLLQETGFSDKLTFRLPATTTLTDGNYKITVKNIVSEHNVPKIDDEVEYSFGTATKETRDTVFIDGLDAGNLIPKGWKITYGTNVREQNTTYTSGPRLLNFPNGGDFNAAFYLRDEGSISHLTYGTYDDSRLSLNKGNYIVSFYYSWWTTGAQSNNRTIDFALLNQSGTAIYEKTEITTNSLIANTNSIPTGSKLWELEIEIPENGNYTLEWRTNNFNFDGALVGNIHVTKTISKATEYKNRLAEALVAAAAAKDATQSSIYDGEAKTTLHQAIHKYEGAAFTSPTAIQAAIHELTAATEAMYAYKALVDAEATAIQKHEAKAAIKELQYFTIMGQRVNQPEKGLNIVKTIYENGKISVRKVMIK